MAESLGGINVVISPNSKTVINIFDIETEIIKDEITGRERSVLNVENKVEDVTQALLTMARGSTRSEEVNELTKQIIAEAVAEEYAAHGINNDPNSLFDTQSEEDVTILGRKRKDTHYHFHSLGKYHDENVSGSFFLFFEIKRTMYS